MIEVLGKYVIGTLVLSALMVAYLKIANRFNITDKPNHRSSHSSPIVRGAGIIFFLAILITEFYNGFKYPWFTSGLSLLSFVSFIDDLTPLSNRLRVSAHLISLILMAFQIELPILPWWIFLCILIVCIGVMNAYNFMDGINGITGIYSLITLFTLSFLESYLIDFMNQDILVMVIISILIFGFFNFRENAVCFAGDIGSFTMAYFLIFSIAGLIITTGDLSFVLLFSVYGVDSVLTIITRLKNKENIFRAHRSHLYQYLANQMKMDHLKVAIIYGVIQLIINILIVYNYQFSHMSLVTLALVTLLPICFGYFYTKLKIEKLMRINEG